jgi:hypothetical protein
VVLQRRGSGTSIGVAVEAKLFGRLRLLTIEAVVQMDSAVADENHRTTDGQLDTMVVAPRRAEVEALLSDARASLAVGDATSRRFTERR